MTKKNKFKGNRRAKTSSLQAQRNRVRGLIGASKALKTFVPKDGKQSGKDAGERARAFQRSLAALLVRSREILATGQFEEFLAWMERQTHSQLATLKQMGALDSDLMREVLDARPLPFNKELMWVAIRLANHSDYLQQFVNAVSELETSFWRGARADVERNISIIEKKFGKSLWLVETKITVEQDFLGLEAQKKTVKAERNLQPRGLPTFMAHYASVRNEPTSLLVRSLEEVSKHIDEQDGNPALKSFLRFKLTNTDQLSAAEASKILRIAQTLSEVDLYETTMSLCRVLAAGERTEKDTESLVASLRRISSIRDDRSTAMLTSLAEETPDKSPHLGDQGRIIRRQDLKALASGVVNPAMTIQVAGSLSKVRRPKQDSTLRRPATAMLRLMAAAMRFESTHGEDRDALEKFLFNHRMFSVSTACLHLFRREMAVSDPESARIRKQVLIDVRNPALAIPRAFSHSSILRSLTFPGTKPKWVDTLLELSELQRLIECGQLGQVVTKTTSLYLTGVAPLSALPLAVALGSTRWKSLKRYRHMLALPIALHLCWQATDSDIAASNLRFAYEEFLDAHGFNSATDCLNLRDSYDNSELVYFLRNVCVPGVIDMSQRLKSSREVDEERQRICAALREVDPSRKSDYDAEIVSITSSLSLQEGRSIVDSSRVHVDTRAIRAWADRELDPIFRRYESLVRAGVGVAENIDVVIRAARNISGVAMLLEVPESEADKILVDMMIMLRDRFLLDPQHGLDSYLSRRVRHHSMTGYLRGPVEEARLITSKDPKTGKYDDNLHWVTELGDQPGEMAKVNRCFETFAEEFDSVVISLRKEVFHVHSTDNPKGLFIVPVSAPMVHLARSAIQSDMSLDSFCSICFSLFWGALDGSLKAAQNHLLVNTKRELATAFNGLRSHLRRRVVDQNRYAGAAAEISRVAEIVQREVDKVAEWFVRRELQLTKNLYSVEKVVDIAIASALASHRPFNPEIRKSVHCDYLVEAVDLVLLAEMFLTALGNVKEHSGLSDERALVRADVRLSELHDRLIMRVENKIGKSAVSPEAMGRVASIRREIQDGSYVDKVRKEGGSGLMKIAATVGQSANGKLEFGFLNGDAFFVEAHLSFISGERIGDPRVKFARVKE